MPAKPPKPEQSTSSLKPMTVLTGASFAIVSFLLIAAIIEIWPTMQQLLGEVAGQGHDHGSDANAANTELTASTSLIFGLFFLSLTPETSLLLMVVLVGALGSNTYTAASFTAHHGAGDFDGAWIWWYLLRVFVASALALIVYFAIRGGLFSTTSTSGAVSPFGIAAVSGLVGLFSEQATDKLQDLFKALFPAAQ